MCMTTCKVTTLTRSLASPLCVQQPNLSCRMTEVTAAMMRPLIRNLYSERKPRYNARYAMLCKVMAAMAGEHIFVPEQHEHVGNMGDHLNFTLRNVTPEQNAAFRDTVKELGRPTKAGRCEKASASGATSTTRPSWVPSTATTGGRTTTWRSAA